jgi:pimeloyl-ACP methyl ester carboxylesterase
VRANSRPATAHCASVRSGRSVRTLATGYQLELTITTPTQIVAGSDDDLVPWSNNQYLDDLLPNSEIHPLDAGHFAWEQAADEYGRLVVDWVSGGYRRRDVG